MSGERRMLVPGLFGLAVLAVASVGYTEQPDFATDLKRANEAMRSEPARGYYEGPFNKAFYSHFSDWLNQCTQRTGQALADLDMPVTLESQGKVSGLRVHPQSKLTECFAGETRKQQFPAPPTPGLVVPVSLRITKQ